MIAAAAKRAQRGEGEDSSSACRTGSTTCRGRQANERLVSQPTVNIEGLVGGYTGPGGKTILPHRAVAKIDLRLVPGHEEGRRGRGAEGAPREARLRRHRGERDRRLRSRPAPPPDAPLIQAQVAVLKRARHRSAAVAAQCRLVSGLRLHRARRSSLASGHFGLGHGGGAHAPDEYYVIESTNPKVQGFDGAVMSFVEYLYELAK